MFYSTSSIFIFQTRNLRSFGMFLCSSQMTNVRWYWPMGRNGFLQEWIWFWNRWNLVVFQNMSNEYILNVLELNIVFKENKFNCEIFWKVTSCATESWEWAQILILSSISWDLQKWRIVIQSTMRQVCQKCIYLVLRRSPETLGPWSNSSSHLFAPWNSTW